MRSRGYRNDDDSDYGDDDYGVDRGDWDDDLDPDERRRIMDGMGRRSGGMRSRSDDPTLEVEEKLGEFLTPDEVGNVMYNGVETLSGAKRKRAEKIIDDAANSRRELGMRYEIGVGNIMWGNDFPHPEGTWPNTRAWLKKTFHDIPIDETRRMVGLSAAELFSFDLAKLKVHADRMAPRPSDFGQVTDDDPTAQRLTDRWAPVKEVGRHWLTDHDFSLIP